jgi:hypothetical protein
LLTLFVTFAYSFFVSNDQMLRGIDGKGEFLEPVSKKATLIAWREA